MRKDCKVYLTNSQEAVISNQNSDCKGLKEGYVMASINGGQFQPLNKSKIRARVKKPIDSSILSIVK